MKLLLFLLLFSIASAEWKTAELNDGSILNYTLPLRVATVIDPPFTMYKEDADRREGNDKFEGYIIDLLQEIKRVSSIDFTYEINLSVDGKYGGRNGDGTWNGMVGMLMRGDADVAAAPLTKTYERSTVVDFSTAFMQSGITILFKRDDSQGTSFFQFLTPFTSTVWLFMLGGFVLVIVQLWILSRFTPKETKDDQLTVAESIWAVAAALVGHGSLWSPKALSTRILLGAWWLFALVLIACYTANLAAFLAVARAKVFFTNVNELAAQNQIKYGAGEGTSTAAFFKESQIETYQQMWPRMQNNLHKDTDEMLARVANGAAALSDSVILEYIANRDCGLRLVGGLISSDGLGFAFQKGSLLERALTTDILFLSDNSILVQLKNKWWASTEDCDQDATSDLDSLGFPAFIGIFTVLLAGVVLADLAGLLEWIITRQTKSKVKDVEQPKAQPRKRRKQSSSANRNGETRRTGESPKPHRKRSSNGKERNNVRKKSSNVRDGFQIKDIPT